MRGLEINLDADTRLVAASLAQMNSATLRISYDQATAEYQTRKAVVFSDHAAIERLREDARRANVPPGWLRY